MAQQGISATLTGNAVELQKAFQEKGYPVAFVGSDVKKLKIFNVLEELNLARRLPARGSKGEEEAKAKDKDGLKPNQIKDKVYELVQYKDGLKPNQIRDEATGAVYELVDILKPNQIKDEENEVVYEVDTKPSVIISITGDAADLPEDQELNQGVKNLMEFCIKFNKDDRFPFCAEDARRALLSNYIHRKADIEKLLPAIIKKEDRKSVLSGDSKILQISYLLQVRIEDLDCNERFEKYSKHFKYPSVRDMLLNVTIDIGGQLTSLENEFEFPEKKKTGDDHDTEPIASVKRLSKSRRVSFIDLMSAGEQKFDYSRRLKMFFDSGIMGAAVKLSGPNSSPWIVDGGSNGGVMKMAGESRLKMRRGGENIQLIGIGVATGNIENYDTTGHSHLILAVDRKEDFPVKAGTNSAAFGYEIEYTKLFEDSLSTVFGVPIVGVLVGGGPGSLQNVVEAIAGNFPVVVIKGTGRVADLICAIREHAPMTYVKHQCKVLNVEFERVKKCSSYRKLEILDLSWKEPEAFVESVESHVLRYHAKNHANKKLSYRSSNVNELFKLLYHTPEEEKLLRLVPNVETAGQKDYAMWSLAFGVAQVDDDTSSFVRTIEFVHPSDSQPRRQLSCLKCAEEVVKVMRRMFPLPVALISYIEYPSSELDNAHDIMELLSMVRPFYIWSMHPGTQKDSFEISVHIRNHKGQKSAIQKETSSQPVVEKPKERQIKCIFQGLVDIERQEIQNAIGNFLHKEFGVVSVALAKILRNVQANVSESPKFTDFFNSISACCLQSTKVLLEFPDVENGRIMPEVFILEQTLDVFGIYRELVAGFFMDMKAEFQQRIHGEDNDGVCKTAYERISRSPAVSLPLYFYEMNPKAQRRLVQSIPDDFLLCKPVNNEPQQTSCSLFCLSSKKTNLGVDSVNLYEHDYDFPIPTSLGPETVESRNQKLKNWTRYFEYLYLNCSDDRPYAPCWDPIALQQKAAAVEVVLAQVAAGDEFLVTHSFDKFRELIMKDVNGVWTDIQKDRGYSSYDSVVMMNRLENAMKKVLYFVFCCKDLVLCENCCEKFGLEPVLASNPNRHKIHASKCSNYSSCGFSKGESDTKKLYSAFRKLSLQNLDGKEIQYLEEDEAKLRKKHSDLKLFCFHWLMKVAFNLKKACSSSFLRHSFLPNSIIVDQLEVNAVNLSSRKKGDVKTIENSEVRSRLRGIFSNAAALCKSGRLILTQKSTLAEDIICTIVTAAEVNRVVAECDVLKTGCSAYERFPYLSARYLSINQPSIKSSAIKSLMTHLIVAAIEGNADKAYQYMSRADLDYIFHDYIDDNELDPRRPAAQKVKSCALHMALERGHTNVAIKIIDRVYSLAREEVFEYFDDPKRAKKLFLEHLFHGAFPAEEQSAGGQIPTSFMYLARHSMTNEMDKLMEILKRLSKVEEFHDHIGNYIIIPKDLNGLNALHYAVLSQSAQCVSWFVPLMYDFHVCASSSNVSFAPDMFDRQEPQNSHAIKSAVSVSWSFHFRYPQFLRMHPPIDVSDSDRRLSISEDWIQTYHYSNYHSAALMDPSKGSKSPMHMEISPYELALLVWRLLDVESMHSQDILHNFATNSVSSYDQLKEKKARHYDQLKEKARHNQVAAEGELHQFDENQEEDNDIRRDLFAESYKQRSSAMYTILSDLEVAADKEVDIDSKKKKGLKQLSNYRSHRAVSRMVFPGLSYLLYVFFATLMAILMTNGLFDEPTKFTHAVVNELGWENPQRSINAIASFSDLTTWWGVLAGFLWESSPMARPFATYNLLGPVLVRQTRTDRSLCNNGQARCTPSNYRSITFSSMDNPNAPYPTPLYFDYVDSKTPFSFFDEGGREFTIPFTEDVVKPQWGNEYYYSGGGYALTFACPTNESVSSHTCRDQPSSGHSTCNCSQRFLDLMPNSSNGREPVSTFFDEGTRALDVSFLVFSPSLQSYVFVHILIEFSETGSISVWDDYQSFSGRYSKQFDFSERMTSLRISQYVTIIYALMYLIYERTDWVVLRSKIPDRLNPSKSKQHAKKWQDFKEGFFQKPITSTLKWLRHYVTFHYRRFVCHWELFLNKSEYYGKIYQLLELIGLGCGYSVVILDLILQSRLRVLFSLASAGKFNDPSSIDPSTGMGMHRAISDAHTLLATEREVIGAYMFFTWTRVFAYLVHMPGWGPYLHAIIATIFSGVVLAFVLVVILLNAAFAIMMYCSYSLTGGDEFKTLQDTFFSMWRMLMGLNEVFSFVENNRGLSGPKFSKGSSGAAYIFLTLLGNLIVMNIVVGLLGEQYQKFGKLSIVNFNRELNANLAKDIIAVKTAEGLNPFSTRIEVGLGKWTFQINLGVTYLDRWKVEAKPNFLLKLMLFVEGYYLDWLLGLVFQWSRLNSPAALFRLKWFHGGVAQERIVCQRMLKFINISTTPLISEAASDIASRQNEQHAAEAPKELAKKQA